MSLQSSRPVNSRGGDSRILAAGNSRTAGQVDDNATTHLRYLVYPFRTDLGLPPPSAVSIDSLPRVQGHRAQWVLGLTIAEILTNKHAERCRQALPGSVPRRLRWPAAAAAGTRPPPACQRTGKFSFRCCTAVVP